MKVKFYRSLDRSVQFFGVKGRYTIPVVCGGIVSLVLSAFVGSLTNGFVGIALFLIGFFCSAMFVLALQGRISEKALMLRLAMGRCSRFIYMRPCRHIRRGDLNSRFGIKKL